MKKLATIGGSVVLALGVLSGCGGDSGGGSDSGDSGGDYCGLIEEAQGKFADFDSADPTIDDFKDLEAQVNEVADAAPEEIQSDWEQLGSVVSDLVSTLEGTGIPTDEPLSEAASEIPPKEQKELMAPLMEDIQSMQETQQAVSDHVKKECDIDLGSASSQ